MKKYLYLTICTFLFQLASTANTEKFDQTFVLDVPELGCSIELPGRTKIQKNDPFDSRLDDRIETPLGSLIFTREIKREEKKIRKKVENQWLPWLESVGYPKDLLEEIEIDETAFMKLRQLWNKDRFASKVFYYFSVDQEYFGLIIVTGKENQDVGDLEALIETKLKNSNKTVGVNFE